MAEFINAGVMHARLRPKRNSFRYHVPYIAIPLSELESKQRQGLLSIDRRNLFSVRTRDYGDRRGELASWIRGVLDAHGLREANGDVVLVTIPRMFGYAFNPVSFWLCFDTDKALRAVVAEVNNTFGERHFYLCAHGDHRAIVPSDEILAEKIFHVSPFLAVTGDYHFAFAWQNGRLGVRIDLHDAQGLMLTTTMAGKREPVRGARLLASFFGNPLLMFKTIGLIHYQAAKLFLKGVKHFRKPPPPAVTLSR